MFVSNHVHSDYSLFDSTIKIVDLVQRIKELNQDAVGLTDHGTVSGLLAFYKECKKNNIKPVMGCEFYITPNLNIKERKNMYHICLYAKDFEGYKNLLRLNSFAHQNVYYEPRISMKQLIEFNEGLICTSACMGGLLSKEDAYEYAERLKYIFEEDFYIEIHTNQMQEQIKYNQKVMAIADSLNIKYTIAVDSHYVRKEDADTHRKWKGIKNNEYYSTDDYYLLSESEVYSKLQYQFSYDVIKKGIATTREIADKCNVVIPIEKRNYPVFPVENKREAVLDICMEGLNTFSDLYIKQFFYELDILEKAEYLNYFLIVHDFLTWCDRNNIPRSAGRGSVTACLVSYFMNITKIDPIKYKLVFERFCHLERITNPDIDCDIATSKRELVINYIKEKYKRVYQVRTINYVSDKASVQRAGQALGIDPKEIDKISKSIKKIDDLPKGKLKDLASKFKGLIQNFGVHASAVVVFPDEVENWCSIEKQGDNFVANYDFHLLEDICGLLKLDILGLKTLDTMAETLSLIKDKVDIDHLPDADEKTFKMLCSANTKGCFQIEGQGMTQLVKDLQPQSFKDLIPLVALYRPSTLHSGMVDIFIKRKKGLEKVVYLHEKLECILADTYGVILYQEQVLEIAKELCGFTLGQADVLRRIIGRKETELIDKAMEDFITKGIANGIDEKTMHIITDQIVTFANYGFNKGHSTAYGYIAYQTAYLKAHYPLEFMTALLNSELDDMDKTVEYLQSVKEMDIEVLPPSIEHSKLKWSCCENSIRVGLKLIKNIGSCDVPLDTNNFYMYMVKHYKLNKRVLESIIKSGCFKGDRGLQLAQLAWWKTYGEKLYGYCEKLFLASKPQQWIDKIKKIPPLSKVKPLQINIYEVEKEVLGFSFVEIIDTFDTKKIERMSDVVCAEIVSVKPWFTKKGKPMAFIKARTKEKLLELVYFNDHAKIIENSVYYLKIDQSNIITDFAKAHAL